MLLSACLLTLLVGCAFRPQAKYSIDRAQGEYTVIARHCYDTYGEDGIVNKYAVAYANEWAKALRTLGHEAYVADLGDQARVCFGTYPSRQSAQRATATVAKILQGLMGGTRVTVRRSVRRVSGRRTFGIQPYPQELERLQKISRALRP